MAGINARLITAADLMPRLANARKQDRLKQCFNRAVIGPRLLVIDVIDLHRRSNSDGCLAQSAAASCAYRANRP
jgi:DNA replication protein DnaC